MAARGSMREGLRWSEVRVGVLLVIGLLLLAYGIFRVGDVFDIFADRYELFTLAPTAAGIIPGAVVSVAGQRVGQVEEIELLPIGEKRNDDHVVIRLSVQTAAREQIREDSRARIRMVGFLGDRFVDISPGSPAFAALEPGDTIPGVPPVEFDDVLITTQRTLQAAERTVSDLQQITAAIRRGEGTVGQLLIDDRLYRRMVGVTDELETVLNRINTADGTLARLIRDPALYEQVSAAAARIDTLGAAILHGEGTLARLLHDDDLYQGILGVVGRADTAIIAAGGTLARLDTAFLGLGGLIGGITDGDGTLGRLLTDPALYDELLKAIVDLQNLINDIRANPRRYRPEVNIDIF